MISEVGLLVGRSLSADRRYSEAAKNSGVGVPDRRCARYLQGIRDVFAPGFFNASPQVKGKADIVLQFVSAASFLALAYLFNSQYLDSNKRNSRRQ